MSGARSGHTLAELEAQADAVQAEIARCHQETRKRALDEILQIVRSQNLAFDDVVKALRTVARRGKAPALYRNPERPKQTWCGKGSPPQWFLEHPDKNALRIG